MSNRAVRELSSALPPVMVLRESDIPADMHGAGAHILRQILYGPMAVSDLAYLLPDGWRKRAEVTLCTLTMRIPNLTEDDDGRIGLMDQSGQMITAWGGDR